jgi:formamidopyrimidine-DNA glycosylase
VRSTRGRSAIPELPEVETVRRELVPWLVGRTVIAVERVDAPPGPKTADLERAVGQRIEAVDRRGKFLLLPLRRIGSAAPGDELVVHLGMTGVLSPHPPKAHLRLRLRLDDAHARAPGTPEGGAPDRGEPEGDASSTLYVQDARRFGRVLVVPRGDYRTLPTLAAMGPEPLGPDFEPAGFARALRRSRIAIKTLLLSQRAVAGVGNIYADEALWRARLHPSTPARDVTGAQARRLHEAVREVLAAAIALQGTTLSDYRTVNGAVGSYRDRLDAYGHDGDPCPRCGTPMTRLVLGQRGTHLCPSCQRRPRSRRRS